MGAPNQIAPVTHVAYVRGSAINVTVRWRNWKVQPVNGTLTWQSARLACPGAIAPIEYINLGIGGAGSVPVSMAANGGHFQTTLTLTNVPDYVAVGGLELKFDMPLTSGPETANNGTAGAFVTWERVCLLNAAPIGVMSTPWVDFLEYTCRWAFGTNSATSLPRDMTKGLYANLRTSQNNVSYSPQGEIYWDMFRSLDPPGIFSSPFKLSNFLEAHGAPEVGPAFADPSNCSTYSGLLQLALAAHGTASNSIFMEKFLPVPEVPTEFGTWPVRWAGSSSYGGGTGKFYFHAVVEVSGLRYDAAVAYLAGPNGNSWQLPAFDWPAGDHWQKHAPSGIAGQAHYGLAYHSTNPAPYPINSSNYQGEPFSKREMPIPTITTLE